MRSTNMAKVGETQRVWKSVIKTLDRAVANVVTFSTIMLANAVTQDKVL